MGNAKKSLLTCHLVALLVSSSVGFLPSFTRSPLNADNHFDYQPSTLCLSGSAEKIGQDSDDDVQTKETSATPILNGKRVLPFKVVAAGLKGHKVAGVYAVLNSSYKRGYVIVVVTNTHACLV